MPAELRRPPALASRTRSSSRRRRPRPRASCRPCSGRTSPCRCAARCSGNRARRPVIVPSIFTGPYRAYCPLTLSPVCSSSMSPLRRQPEAVEPARLALGRLGVGTPAVPGSSRSRAGPRRTGTSPRTTGRSRRASASRRRASGPSRYLSVAVFPFSDPFTGGIWGFANVATSASPSGLNVTTPRLVRHSPWNVGSSACADATAASSNDRPRTRIARRMRDLLAVMSSRRRNRIGNRSSSEPCRWPRSIIDPRYKLKLQIASIVGSDPRDPAAGRLAYHDHGCENEDRRA